MTKKIVELTSTGWEAELAEWVYGVPHPDWAAGVEVGHRPQECGAIRALWATALVEQLVKGCVFLYTASQRRGWLLTVAH